MGVGDWLFGDGKEDEEIGLLASGDQIRSLPVIIQPQSSPHMHHLQPTMPAPPFKTTAVFERIVSEISLTDYKGKWLILFFYPADFSILCPAELIELSDRVEEFKAINCEVVACSTDSHFSHITWLGISRSRGGLGKMNIPLLADKNSEVSKAYGVYCAETGIAYRGMFLIDDTQKLRQITINDMAVRRSINEMLRLVMAYQDTDLNGPACEIQKKSTERLEILITNDEASATSTKSKKESKKEVKAKKLKDVGTQAPRKVSDSADSKMSTDDPADSADPTETSDPTASRRSSDGSLYTSLPDSPDTKKSSRKSSKKNGEDPSESRRTSVDCGCPNPAENKS